MKNKNLAVYGIYPDRASLVRGLESLQDCGFLNSDISVLSSTASGFEEFAHENTTKSPEGATAGGISGATVGGVLGWLAGIGTLAIPGVGPLIAAGPIMATLAGIGVGGTLGGIAGSLVGYGIPEYEAKRYESSLNDGGILISVHAETSELVDEAEKVLEETGAEDISTKTDSSCSKKQSNA